MITRIVAAITLGGVLLQSCKENVHTPVLQTEITSPNSKEAKLSTPPVAIQASAMDILAKKQVPILCYHHLNDFRPGDSHAYKDFTVPPALFAAQMKALADSGYTTILPDELYDYLNYGKPLPPKPVMLTFDDTDLEQYTVGAKEMDKYGFKGVYFIMTISINRPRYMSAAQLKELSDSGHVIACHTWDHNRVTLYDSAAWDKQIVETKKKLETITGKPVEYFAFPFGIWNKESLPEVKSRGYKMAFSLSQKRDSTEPLYSVRRMIVPGSWTVPGMFKAMHATFK